MKEIADRVWREPAVFIGLLVTLALLVGAFLTGSDWNWETIVAVIAPLLSALGIRPLVTPNPTVAEHEHELIGKSIGEGTIFDVGEPKG